MQIRDGAIAVKKTWLLAVLALVVAFGAGFAAAWGVFGSGSTSSQASSSGALEQPSGSSPEAAAGGVDEAPSRPPVISTEQLHPIVSAPEMRIIDLRTPAKFARGHIPFALSLPSKSLLDPDARIKGALVSDEQVAETFGWLGIGKDSYVVLYDDKGGYQASRVFWKLRHFGHRQVSVLDGGFPKWESEDREISLATAAVTPGIFPVELAPQRLATADWILDHHSDPDVLILDVRPGRRYGERHIPGALNLYWKETRNRNGTLRDLEDLRELFESKGITKDKTIVTYCQGGEHNAHTYFVLKVLGYPTVRSYEEAWPGWSIDGLPVISGPSPGAFGTGG